jgi:hypothetical protein
MVGHSPTGASNLLADSLSSIVGPGFPLNALSFALDGPVAWGVLE